LGLSLFASGVDLFLQLRVFIVTLMEVI